MISLPYVTLRLCPAHHHGPVPQPSRVGDPRAVVESEAARVLQPPGAGIIDHLQHQSLGVQEDIQGQDLAQCAGVPGEKYLVTVTQKRVTVTRLLRHFVITTEQCNALYQTVVA